MLRFAFSCVLLFCVLQHQALNIILLTTITIKSAEQMLVAPLVHAFGLSRRVGVNVENLAEGEFFSSDHRAIWTCF
jgi:hypothetical protein